MSSAIAERPLGANAAALLAQARAVPQVCLEQRSAAVTAVVFHARTIALVDGDRQCAEIAVVAIDVERVLADHREAQRGSTGVTVDLALTSYVAAAVALIRREVDEAMYRWQLTSSGP